MTNPAIVDSQDLRERLNSTTPPRVIDVRTPGEFETADIAGAYNVPLELLREHRDEIVTHVDEDVVRTAGLANVHILDGGIAAWRVKGFAVNRGRPRWDLERQVRLVGASTDQTAR